MTSEAYAAREYFYVGGEYKVDDENRHYFVGQIYVEHLTPACGVSQPYPIVFMHGGAQTGTVCTISQEKVRILTI